MTLAQWYACSQLHLDAQTTVDLLDVLACLDDPGRDDELVSCALESLAAADPRAQALAVPDLVALLARAVDDDLRNRAAALLLATTGPLLTPAALATVGDQSAAELADLVAELAPPRPGRVLTPFSDVSESAPHLLGIALLREAMSADDGDRTAEEAPRGAADHLISGEAELWYVAEARGGALGRVAQLLALECSALAGEEPSSLLAALGVDEHGYWRGEPDLVRARLLVRLDELGLAERGERAAWLCREATTLECYLSAPGDSRRTGVGWLGLGGSDMGRAAQVVLWQAVCWELAVGEDPEGAASDLAVPWGPPEPHRDGVEHLNLPGNFAALRGPFAHLAKLRFPLSGKKVPNRVRLFGDVSRGNRPGAVTMVCSPWLDRAKSYYNARQDDDLTKPAEGWPGLDDTVAVLRAAANARTLVRLVEELVRADLPVPVFAWDLVHNLLDALGSARLRETLRTMSQPGLVSRSRLPGSVLSLAKGAHSHLERLGKGQLHDAVPALQVAHLRAYTEESDGRWPRQVHWLNRQPAYMVLAHLVFEVLSGELASTNRPRTPWLRGGPGSPAAELLRLLFGPVWDGVNKPAKSINEPGALSLETFPEHVGRRAESWDWRGTYVSGGWVTLYPAALSSPTALERWQTLDPLDKYRINGGALMHVLTQRLLALAEADGLTPDHPWLVEWRTEIEKVNAPRFLARVVRQQLTRFLAQAARNDAEHEVQLLALRAILEFSGQTVRFHDLAGVSLAETWSREGAAGPGAAVLGSEWLRAVTGSATRPLSAARGPWSVLGARRAAEQREESVRSYLATLLRSELPPEFATVLDDLDREHTTPLLTMAPAVETDALAALFSQRRGGVDWTAELPGAALASGARLGVVAGRESDEPEAWLLVNVGDGTPERGPRTAWVVGDLVSVTPREKTAVPPPTGRPGDLVRATITWRDDVVSVRPEGRQAWPVPQNDEDLVTRWLPDPLAAREQEFEAAALVRRTRAGSWLPVARDLTRLIVDRFGQRQEQDLVVVEEAADGDEWELSTGFGHHYRVREDSFTATLQEALDGARVGSDTGETRSLAGLRVRARLRLDGDRLRLDLVEGGIDDANLRWRDQFLGRAVQLATRREGCWWLDASPDGPEGLPPVAVELAGHVDPDAGDRVRVRLSSGGWDARAQRLGRARAHHLPFDALAVRRWDDLGALRGHLRAGPGSTFTLAELTGAEADGYLEAVTTAGLPVFVAADSLSFLPGTPHPALVTGREVRWQRLSRRPTVPTRAATPVPLVQAPAEIGILHGLLARRTPGVEEVEVWLDLGSRAMVVPVPTSAFTGYPGTVGAHVTVVRVDEGWEFAAEQRDPMARATWTTTTAPTPDDAVALSVAAVPGHGAAVVLQATDRPVLHLADPNGPRADALSCAAPRGGRVKRVRPAFATDALGAKLDIVVLKSASGSLTGHSRTGAFRTPAPWLTAQLVLTEESDAAGATWLDARREFTEGRGSRRAGSPNRLSPRAAPAEEEAPAWPTGYQEWLAEGDEHVLASWVSGDRNAVRLLDLALPHDPRLPSLGQLEVVPLRPGERASHLRGHPYSPHGVRVLVRHGTAGWTASYRTEPLTLAQFRDTVLNAVSGPQRRRRKIWYAGQTPDGRHRFEWGFGWTMELDPEELDLRDEREGQLPYFFNDCLTDLRVTKVGDRLALKVGDVDWEVERLVCEDAEQGVLHKLQVRLAVSPGGQPRVYVEAVHARTRTVGGAGEGVQPTKRSRLRHARLDSDGAALLLERLGPDALRRGDTFSVLARLDLDQLPGAPGATEMVFTVLTPDVASADPERQPQKGESLVLVAGTIRPTATRLSNDFVVPFGLPTGPTTDTAFSVNVPRRQFSVRESTLRQAFRSGAEDAFLGVSMLVRLSERNDDGTWRASVVDAPVRPWPALRSWAKHAPDHAYVTIGQPLGVGAVLIEPRPGVIARMPLDRREAPAAGSLCRIVVGPSGHRLVPVIEGGARYVPESEAGRPVHLLLKDNALGRRGTGGRGGFTVGGLPGIDVNDDDVAVESARWRPPRLGTIRRTRAGLELVRGRQGNAGRLVAGPTIERVKQQQRTPPPPRRDWPELSFRDATPDELVAHAERGRWRYHDRVTGYLDYHGKLVDAPYPDPVRSTDGPLFFDDRWRLRYTPDELLRFGFSAAEVLEQGLPENGGWYPVAAPSPDGGLWVELSPGRVVELSGTLLHSPSTDASALDDLSWHLFAPGDEVRLELLRDRGSALPTLVLHNWRPSPRGWFGRHRALLVPSPGERGPRRLGQGLAALTWSGSRHLGRRPVWLQPNNRTESFDGTLAPGDVVLLLAGDAGYGIAGAPRYAVQIAEEWADAAWLRAAMIDIGAGRAVLRALGGALPAIVTAVDGATVEVGPAGGTPSGSLLAGHVLGPLDDEHVVFRSGPALLRLPLADLLPGVPVTARVTIAQGFTRTDRLLWLRRVGERWVSPAASARAGTFRAEPLAATTGGIVVHTPADMAVQWLPLSELGPVPNDVADPALAFLQAQGGRLDVVQTAPGTVSFLGSHEGRRVARQLDSGAALLAVPQHLTATDPGRNWSYLASIHPTLGLVTLNSERELRLGEAVAIEVERTQSTLSAIPSGQGRVRLSLAPWLVVALREARVDGILDIAIVRARARARTALFVTALAPGADAAGSVEVQLVAAYSSRQAGASLNAVRALVSEWLAGSGRALLLTQEPSEPLDQELAPLLAGVLLLAELGADGDAAAAALAVHGAHALGRLASGSMHQEVLLREWLLRDPGLPRRHRWVRLDRLDLGGRALSQQDNGRPSDPYVWEGAASDPHFDGRLAYWQQEQLVHACNGVLDTSFEPDRGLRATARTLLYATGDFSRLDDVWADLSGTRLARLAALGRALTPGPEVSVAQPRLTTWQLVELRRIWNDSLRGELPLPLTLLPKDAPPLAPRSLRWAEEALAELEAVQDE